MKRIREIGYRNIQVSGSFNSLDPQKLRELADRHELTIIGSHLPVDMFETNLQEVIRRTKIFGASHVAIPYFEPRSEGEFSDWEKLAQNCAHWSKELKKESIHLQYHNHAHEFCKFGIDNGRGGVMPYELLMAQIPHLQAELDLAWAARAGFNSVDVLKQVSGNVDQVHIKDWGVSEKGEPIWREVGEGHLNWNDIIPACKSAGVEMYIVEQDECPVTNDPFQSIAISFENLMKMAL